MRNTLDNLAKYWSVSAGAAETALTQAQRKSDRAEIVRDLITAAKDCGEALAAAKLYDKKIGHDCLTTPTVKIYEKITACADYFK